MAGAVEPALLSDIGVGEAARGSGIDLTTGWPPRLSGSKYLPMKESAPIVPGLASATAVASLLAAMVVMVLGFIAREQMAKSSPATSRTPR
ncbi:hypothetical protein ACFWP7_18540 [Streptomyces sp. NPDC058470]|uniref:hypothetical protein n=1 Tax=Streptomyces sp. NPDC058470 TaxID=3346515 RepID=UPI00365CB244